MAEEHDDELLLDTPVDEQHDESADTDDISIEIEGDDPEPETDLVKDLRRQLIDAKRQARTVDRQAQPEPPEPGKRPTIEDCEWDQDRHDAALDKWEAAKDARREWERTKGQVEQQRNHAFERRVSDYRGAAARLGVRDFGEAEAIVLDRVPELLRNAVLQYAKDPAKVTYALGKHPARLEALLVKGDPAVGGDPIEWIRGIDDIERNMKVVNRRKPPEPEADTIVRGTAPLATQNYDKKLASLEKEAERTGDRTKIIAFKREQREKGK